jgi:hypothetical protein
LSGDGRRIRFAGDEAQVPAEAAALAAAGIACWLRLAGTTMEASIMELDQSYVWITTRRLRTGTRDEFSRAWRPSEFPEGMLRAYECYSADGNEVVGISVWDSAESRERYRLSAVETERRQAMAPFVIEERSGFYLGRELKIPER